MEWPALSDEVCPVVPLLGLSDYSNPLHRATFSACIMPLLPQQRIFFGRGKQRKYNNCYYRSETVLHPPTYHVDRFRNYDERRKININTTMMYITQHMQMVMGRRPKGLFLHHNVSPYHYTQWPPAEQAMDCYTQVELKDAKNYTLEELADCDFVVANVWGDWCKVVNLLNAIDKPVFWCFNDHVNSSIMMEDY